MSKFPQTLVTIVGPPAVGKMTVGQALGRLTGLPLFHNHLSIEAVLPVFEFGSEPFSRLVGEFRRRMFTEVAASDLPGLIFTYVWAFDQPSDATFIEEMTGIFEERGGRAVFVELWADLETRLERNQSASRLAVKSSKRDLERSRQRLMGLEERYRMSSDGEFPFPDHLWIDNSQLPPEGAAELIAERFSLEVRIPEGGPE